MSAPSVAGEAAPTESVEPVTLPPELVEELVGYGLQTQPGQALWRGFLLGRELPKGKGGVTVREAVYQPSQPSHERVPI